MSHCIFVLYPFHYNTIPFNFFNEQNYIVSIVEKLRKYLSCLIDRLLCKRTWSVQLAESFPWHARMQWRIQVKAAE